MVITGKGSNGARDPRTRRRIDAGFHLRDLLRSVIVHSELESDILPGESELMLSYGASRQVVRDALRLLSDEGLVRRVQGNGTFALAAKLDYGRDPLDGSVGQPEIHHQILQSERSSAPEVVLRRLRLPPGTECGVIDYLTYVAGSVYSICTAYVPVELIALSEGSHPGSEWWMRFVRAGLPVGVASFRTEATVADKIVADILEVSPGAPILSVERLLNSQDGSPLEFAFERIRGDRSTLHHRMPRGPLQSWATTPSAPHT